MPHILIVEDDTDINNSTAAYLRRQGCVCSQAFSGTEWRLLWQAGGIDLLLADLMLPGLILLLAALGLAIVRELMERMGGRVAAQVIEKELRITLSFIIYPTPHDTPGKSRP